MSAAPSDTRVWGPDGGELALIARNVSTRYIAIAIDGIVGLLLLPFNVSHLGPAAYGLWALTASVTAYFSVLDLGYGGALVKFVAQYRAWRDRQGLNEILSTMCLLFTAVGALTFVATVVIAWQFGRLFNVSPEQVDTGRKVLMLLGVFIAVRFSLAIFGSVVYGFQRYYLNNAVSILTTAATAIVNVAVLGTGHSLVTLVAATTAVRILSLGGFVWTAFRVYPGLRLSLNLCRKERLREVTGFSVYMLVLDWSARLNYSADALVIGAMINTTAVAVWTVAQRIAEITQQLSYQLNDALFPLVVDSDAGRRPERLQTILLIGTRLSLGLAMPMCVGIAIMAEQIIHAWVGDRFAGSVLITRTLMLVVIIRIAVATAYQVLKGGGKHRLLAVANSTTAIVNVVISIVLAPRYGLEGVAIGTLIPVGFTAAFVMYPVACRRVGLPLGYVLKRTVWPAVWPLAGLGSVLWIGNRVFQPTHLPAIALQLVVAGLVYQALFLLAIPADERRMYWGKLMEVVRRNRRVPVAA